MVGDVFGVVVVFGCGVFVVGGAEGEDCGGGRCASGRGCDVPIAVLQGRRRVGLWKVSSL